MKGGLIMEVKFLKSNEIPKNSIFVNFIKTELTDKEVKNDLIKLCSEFPNIITFEYECNEYNVTLNKGTVTIRNAVHEENSIPKYFKRISMSADDFLNSLLKIT